MRNVVIGSVPVAVGSDIVSNNRVVVTDEEAAELVARGLGEDQGAADEVQPKAKLGKEKK